MPSSSELKQMVLIALAFWLVVILLFCVGCTHHPDRRRAGYAGGIETRSRSV